MASQQFETSSLPSRVVFGSGALAHLNNHLARLKATRVVVVTTPGRQEMASTVGAQLGTGCVGLLDIAREHVPRSAVEAGRKEVQRVDADCIVTIGGGSATGLGKAIALTRDLQFVAIPTTYAGSEMTAVYGISDDGRKQTGRDERVRPSLVIYDPELTLELPLAASISSLFNATAHAVSALYGSQRDPITPLIAEEAIAVLSSSISQLPERTSELHVRELALFGACLAGSCLSTTVLGLHHRLCHVLGGSFGTPHSQTHTVVLPYVVDFFRDAAPDATEAIGRALGVDDPAACLFDLAESVHAPTDLRSLGLRPDDLERVVQLALQTKIPSPRVVDPDNLSELLIAAFHGRRPADASSRSHSVLPPNDSSAISSFPRPPATPNMVLPEKTLRGFGAHHESEAIVGALPRDQNNPRHVPFGLYTEQINTTAFSAPRQSSKRSLLYRIRPSVNAAEFIRLQHAGMASGGRKVDPSLVRWKNLPLSTSADFVDGLVTMGGHGTNGSSPGYAIHRFAANTSMTDRAFTSADGELLIVPELGAMTIHTEMGSFSLSPGEICLIPRGIRIRVELIAAAAFGSIFEIFQTSFRLPDRGPMGSNGLADERHFEAPVAQFEDRVCPRYQIVTKYGGQLFESTQAHSPFDVVAWHGNLCPYKYALDNFCPVSNVSFDHPDPSIYTLLTCRRLDGTAIGALVVFPTRRENTEHTLRLPYFHRNAATEYNGIILRAGQDTAAAPWLSPAMTAHGPSPESYAQAIGATDEKSDATKNISSQSQCFYQFESSLPFAQSDWARRAENRDSGWLKRRAGFPARFDPNAP